jgi:methyltransferase (TIGR00027 family)
VAERAVLTDMGVLADPFAAGMLTPSMGVTVSLVRRLPYRMRARSVTLAGLAARVAWFDDQVIKALEAGVEQVVLIGAGYDSRAWRFERAGVQYFELDHAGTQQDKIRRAPGPGPTYVEADLTSHSAADALAARGFVAARAALFVMEGVTMYLHEEVVRHQLDGLSRLPATGSRLAVDFYPPADAGTSGNRRQGRLQRMARIGSGEGFRLAVDRIGAAELVQESGWEVTDETSLRDVARHLVEPGSGLPVDSVNQHKTLVAAIRS